MKIKNLSFTAGHLSFSNLNLDFSEPGVTLITGENGCGKSSLLQEILFGGSDSIQFPDAGKEKAYHENPASLFSYVPQTPPAVPERINDFVYKDCTGGDEQKKERLYERLGLSHLSPETKVSALSGGERRKLVICSAVLKDTPYLLMDEPTNDLDDQSTDALVGLLKELETDMTILIVSHDRRLLDVFENHLQISPEKTISDNEKKMINQDNTKKMITSGNKKMIASDNKKVIIPDHVKKMIISNNVKKPAEPSTRRKSLSALSFRSFRYLRRFGAHTTFLLSGILVLFLSIFLLTYNTSLYRENYSGENGSYAPDVIHTYKAEYAYTDTNRYYAEAQGLKIGESRKTRMIQSDDLKNLAEKNDIEKIVTFDESVFYKNAVTEEAVRVPGRFLSDFTYNYTKANHYLGTLIYGMYPEDGSNDICLPQNRLQEFGLDQAAPDENLGRQVNYKKKTYHLTGITDGELILLPYQGNSDGFVTVTDKSKGASNTIYDRRSGEQDASTSSKDGFDTMPSGQLEKNGSPENNKSEVTEETKGLFIYTKTGTEQKVLNELMEHYPAENYTSSCFVKVWERAYNKEFVIQHVLGLNLTLSGIFLILLTIIKHHQRKGDRESLRDAIDYFLCPARIYREYLLLELIGLAIPFAGIFVTNHIINSLAGQIDLILLIDTMIVLVPLMVMSAAARRRTVCRNI